MSNEPSSARGRPREPAEERAPEILLPDRTPELSPAAARTLLRILLRAHRATLPSTPSET